MLKSIISGIIAILVLLILMWILLHPQRRWNWNKYTPIRIAVLIVTIVIFSVTYVSYKWGVNKGVKKTEVLHILNNLKSNSIESIVLFSESNDYNFRDTIIINNEAEIENFSQALNSFESLSPNHPITLWKINLKILLRNRQLDDIRLNLIKDKKSGILFFYIIRDTKLWGSYYLGSYFNTDLENLIQKFYFENAKMKTK